MRRSTLAIAFSSLTLASALFAATAAGAATGPTGKLLAGSEETVLRLHDLPPGYRIGDDSGCGALVPSADRGSQRTAVARFFRWIARYWPEECTYYYEQVFAVPKLGSAPPLVAAGVINTPSETAAAAGLRLIKPLLAPGYELGGPVAISPGGPRALVLDSPDETVEGRPHRPATYLLWRSGKRIATVEAAGEKQHRDYRAALHFARLEQARLEAPSPYTKGEKDDAEVALDDPGLGFPVYWVGSDFEPGGGLPPAPLEDAFTRYGPPGIKAELWYEGFILSAWTEASWKRFTASALGPVNLKARCTSEEPFALAGGSAVIYATFDGRFRHCPSRRPDRFYAIAHLGGMVIGVNLSNCLKCRPGVSGPYGSKRAVVAILRALTVRPKPDF